MQVFIKSRGLKFALSVFLLLYPVAAKAESFLLPMPDMTAIDACVQKSRGDSAKSGGCFRSVRQLCLNNYYENYQACLPQQTKLWRDLAELELDWLESIGRNAQSVKIREALTADNAEFCDTKRSGKMRELCRYQAFQEAAVLLRINRIWLGGKLPK